MDMTPQTWPDWYDGRHINEVLFCQQFLEKHPMKCVRGRLFTVDGLIEDEGQIGNLILEEISGVLTSGLSKVVTNLLASIKLQAYSPPLPIETDRIHVANGTYFMDGSFTADKSYCNNRLTVAYNPDAPIPKKWLQFLSELLQPEDIPTLQEFLGYCLLPTTKGQKMLMLIGKGGEGKSRIGLVMRSLLGDSMNTTSIQKVESNRFSRADLENKLLMVDDDMDMSALPKTNYIKSIVTSECKMDMERKGIQSYQSQLYVRFLCFGNGALTALHDKSDGFFRRQIVLTTKDRPAGRADDPFLVDKLLREKEGIFLWCLEGLHRLIGNNYQFSISGKARENMETVKRSSNNVIEFLQSEGYIRFRADSEASSKAIYEAYTRWCDDNAQKPMRWEFVRKPGVISAHSLTSKTAGLTRTAFRLPGKRVAPAACVAWHLTSGTAGRRKEKNSIPLPMNCLTAVLRRTFLKPSGCAIPNIAGTWNAPHPGFPKKRGNNQ